MHKPLNQPDHLITPKLLEEIKRLSLPDRPLSPMITTAKGTLNILREAQKCFHEALEYFFSGSLQNLRSQQEGDITKISLDVSGEDEQVYREVEARLMQLTRQYAAANFARVLDRKTPPADVNEILSETLRKLTPLLQDAKVRVKKIPASEIKPEGAIFGNYCFIPFLYQLEHAIFYEWFLRGGNPAALHGRGKISFMPADFVAPPPPDAELSDYVLQTHYGGMFEGRRVFQEKIVPLITEEDRAREEQWDAETEAKIRQKKAPFQGFVAQEMALAKLARLEELDKRYRAAGRMIMETCVNGTVLPDVVYKTSDNGIDYGIEITSTMTKEVRKHDPKAGSLPIFRLFYGDGGGRSISVTARHEKETSISFYDDSFYMAYHTKDELMPAASVARSNTALLFDERLVLPHIGLLDLARAHPGGFAWAERVLIPALEKIAEMLLDQEEFESSATILEDLGVSLKDIEEEPSPEEVLEDMQDDDEASEAVIEKPVFTYTPAQSAATKAVRATRFGDMLYDRAHDAVYYLRSSHGLAASDRNRDLYRELTDEEIPEGMVLREIPFERSGLTWREVEDVLVNHFGIEKDRQKGSHMQYRRHLPGKEKLHATILAHYQERAKRKTLASVLRSLHIPAPLFWITVSKTYKVASLRPEDIEGLSVKLAEDMKAV